MPDGFTYEGDWTDGAMTGTGTARYAEGDIYEGGLQNGVRAGLGTLTRTTGEVLSGLWENGILTQPAVPNTGAAATTDDAPTEQPASE
jgi:hypothetical protein